MMSLIKNLKDVFRGVEKKRVVKPIIIIGSGRCGTTLLFKMFAKHPELAPTLGYPDGEDHVGWIEHGKCIISGLGETPAIDLGRTGFDYCLHMNEKDVTPEVVEAMTSYYLENVLPQDNSKRALAKNGHLSNKLRYVRGIFPDAKFVHIIRDCLPVVSSWMTIMDYNHKELVLYLPDSKFPCFWVLHAPLDAPRDEFFKNEDRMYPGGGPAVLADYWSISNRNIPLQLSGSPQQLLTIKYEDLCSNTLETLNKISDFCEISPFTEIPIPINAGTHEKYKEYLSEEQISQLTEHSRETRALFGYI